VTQTRRVAILGATGHVGKCLVEALSADARYEVVAVARSMPKLEAFLRSLPASDGIRQCHLDAFTDGAYDAVVNCIGEGDPSALARDAGGVMSVTEHFDDITMGYLRSHPGTRLVNFSSGAAYGGSFAEPAREESTAGFEVNRLHASDVYGLAKLSSEARHRAAADCSIVDLRLFSFFSRHIDSCRRYFMNDVMAAIADSTVLITGEADIVRDYVDRSDLASLVACVIESEPRNDVLDVYSSGPVRKSELLKELAGLYGLEYRIDPGLDISSSTGEKLNYYSVNRRAGEIGYVPRYSSIETLRREVDAVMGQAERGQVE